MDGVIIDTLHLFLWITDRLISLLIMDLRVADVITGRQTFAFIDRNTNIARYECFLSRLGINFRFHVNTGNKQMEYRDLTGPEKHKLYKAIDLNALLPPTTIKIPEINEIWKTFYEIFIFICQDNVTAAQLGPLKDNLHKWVTLFAKTYQSKNITPYIHAFVHVPEFLEKYGNLNFLTNKVWKS